MDSESKPEKDKIDRVDINKRRRQVYEDQNKGRKITPAQNRRMNQKAKKALGRGKR